MNTKPTLYKSTLSNVPTLATTDEVAELPIRLEQKIMSLDACLEALELGDLVRPLVFSNGVFDILHRGHVSYLDQAAQLGASLVVAVNSDASVKRLGKGAERPLNPCDDRQAMLAALSSVSAVIAFEEDTPYEVIKALKPELIVKGGDYEMARLPETALVKTWGGRALAIPFAYERSTTALVQKIRHSTPISG